MTHRMCGASLMCCLACAAVSPAFGMPSAFSRRGVEWGLPSLGVNIASNGYSNGISTHGGFALSTDLSYGVHTGAFGHEYTRIFIDDLGSTALLAGDLSIKGVGVMQPLFESGTSAAAVEIGLASYDATSGTSFFGGGRAVDSHQSGPFIGFRSSSMLSKTLAFNIMARVLAAHSAAWQVGSGINVPLSRRWGWQLDYNRAHVGGAASTTADIFTTGFRWLISN